MKETLPPSPKSIAIIMDGNGRWAKKKGLPKIEGHRKGAKSVQEAIEACIENKISYLTLYAFSSENWQRPSDEVNSLMELLQFYLGRELKQLHKNNVCLKIIGDRNRLPNNIIKQIAKAENLTKDNKSLHLVVALSYGARQEITNAAKRLSEEIKDGNININDVNEDMFSSFLYTKNVPEPDILIRTSGEKRLSNFLLWQMAYTELFFIDVLWPDFKKHHIEEIIQEFNKRERRYGKS